MRRLVVFLHRPMHWQSTSSHIGNVNECLGFHLFLFHFQGSCSLPLLSPSLLSPPLYQLGGLGSAVSSPVGSGRSPSRWTIWCIFEPKRMAQMAQSIWYTFEWKCEAFHIFILLYQTVILSTLIGWRLFVLINDMLCYVMNTGAAYRCRHGCYWTDWTILDAFQFCNFILRKKRFNLGSRYTASVTYSDLDLDDNRQSPMDTTAMKWTCTTDKTKFLKKVSNSSNMLCQTFAVEAAKELAILRSLAY